MSKYVITGKKFRVFSSFISYDCRELFYQFVEKKHGKGYKYKIEDIDEFNHFQNDLFECGIQLNQSVDIYFNGMARRIIKSSNYSWELAESPTPQCANG